MIHRGPRRSASESCRRVCRSIVPAGLPVNRDGQPAGPPGQPNCQSDRAGRPSGQHFQPTSGDCCAMFHESCIARFGSLTYNREEGSAVGRGRFREAIGRGGCGDGAASGGIDGGTIPTFTGLTGRVGELGTVSCRLRSNAHALPLQCMGRPTESTAMRRSAAEKFATLS